MGENLGRTDLGNSERFLRLHADHVRYCKHTKMWHKWNGSVWEPDYLTYIPELAKDTVRAMYAELSIDSDADRRKELFKFIQKTESERSLTAMVNLTRTDPRVAADITSFDSNPLLFNCLNGTINLQSGELYPHRREDFITKQSPVNFDPDATSEIWNKFLDTCTKGNKDFELFLQRVVGYSLYGIPNEKVLFVLHGPKDTGKSTFIDIIMYMFGEYATTADFSTFLKKDRESSGPTDGLASLCGSRLVSSIEVDEGKQLALALIKQVTGGDEIRARHLHKSSFVYRPQFSLWLVCNDAPVVDHDDEAVWRRILRIPFDNIVARDKQDRSLGQTLKSSEVASAVLAWAVKGCTQWFDQGLAVPDIVLNATASYKADSNPLIEFVNLRCILVSEASSSVSELRREYDIWCAQSNHKVRLNHLEFAKAVRDLGCEVGKKGGARVWKGITIQTDAEAIYDQVK